MHSVNIQGLYMMKRRACRSFVSLLLPPSHFMIIEKIIFFSLHSYRMCQKTELLRLLSQHLLTSYFFCFILSYIKEKSTYAKYDYDLFNVNININSSNSIFALIYNI